MSTARATVAIVLVLGFALVTQAQVTLFEAGFETGEGYSDASGGDVYLARNWRGGGSNQQGWYAEYYIYMTAYPSATRHIAAVTDDRAHTGTQSMKQPKEDYYYNYVSHDFAKQKNGIVTVEFYYWFDNVESAVLQKGDCNNIIYQVSDYGSRTSVSQPVNDYRFGEFYTPYGGDVSLGSNHLRYPSGAAYNNDLIVTGIAGEQQWIGMRLVFDMDDQELSIYTDEDDDGTFIRRVDQARFYTNQMDWTSIEAGLSCFSVNQICTGNYFTNASYDIYVDDLNITWEPTPAVRTLFECGFEIEEGYTMDPLVSNYKGGAGNQQGWYGEVYYSKSQGSNAGIVTNDTAHGGSRSLRVPLEDFTYDWYRHPMEEKSNGVMTVEYWIYLESVNISDKNQVNNLILNLDDRFDPSGTEYTYRGPGGFMYDMYNDYGGLVNAETPDSYSVYPNTFKETGVAAQGVWNGFRAVIDLDHGTYDFDVDTGGGWVRKLTGTAMYNASETYLNVIDEIAFYQLCGANYFNDPNYGAYIDDIRVTWFIPPTGTVILIK